MRQKKHRGEERNGKIPSGRPLSIFPIFIKKHQKKHSKHQKTRQGIKQNIDEMADGFIPPKEALLDRKSCNTEGGNYYNNI